MRAVLDHVIRLTGDGPVAARVLYGELVLMNLADVLDPPSPNGAVDA